MRISKILAIAALVLFSTGIAANAAPPPPDHKPNPGHSRVEKKPVPPKQAVKKQAPKPKKIQEAPKGHKPVKPDHKPQPQQHKKPQPPR